MPFGNRTASSAVRDKAGPAISNISPTLLIISPPSSSSARAGELAPSLTHSSLVAAVLRDNLALFSSSLTNSWITVVIVVLHASSLEPRRPFSSSVTNSPFPVDVVLPQIPSSLFAALSKSPVPCRRRRPSRKLHHPSSLPFSVTNSTRFPAAHRPVVVLDAQTTRSPSSSGSRFFSLTV
ncbi:hypothetical protein JVT61DRAFT_12565 [Boletus reticuloceps]|uniref:Uncharacterized protein n=1 Tax=Boletus reticuloceps TaxID=495285 RepID=A0A8I2YDQ4_9AGAM|nr:hypothetical protein JVT61DRAFT_12565 [Boletus reticuloceps]